MGVGAVPLWLLKHTVTIEPYEGTGSKGKIYGAAFTSRAFVDDSVSMVRDSNGVQVVSSSTVILPLNTNCPVGSKVTTSTRTSLSLQSLRRDGGGLPTPDHLEVKLQ